jgi:hypothetical protein
MSYVPGSGTFANDPELDVAYELLPAQITVYDCLTRASPARAPSSKKWQRAIEMRSHDAMVFSFCLIFGFYVQHDVYESLAWPQ